MEPRCQLIERLRRLSLAGPRSLTTRGRSLEARVHLNQLTVRHARQLRITEPGRGATAEDVGGFWFVVGYSHVEGPDVIPEV